MRFNIPGTSAATESEYQVHGMTCGGCASGVSREIGRLDGVGDVQVWLVPGDTSKITVRSTGPMSPEAVRAAVANARYGLAGSK